MNTIEFWLNMLGAALVLLFIVMMAFWMMGLIP